MSLEKQIFSMVGIQDDKQHWINMYIKLFLLYIQKFLYLLSYLGVKLTGLFSSFTRLFEEMKLQMTSIPKTKPIKAIFLIGMIDANLILANFTFVILQMTIHSHLAYEKHNNYALLKKIKLSVV